MENMVGLTLLPNHFTDDEILTVIARLTLQNSLYSSTSTPEACTPRIRYVLTCGLVMKLKNAIERLDKRTKLRKYYRLFAYTQKDYLYMVCSEYTCNCDLLQTWSKDELFSIAEELIDKSINLSTSLQRELACHPLIKYLPSHSLSIDFDRQFLTQVQLYHAMIARPEGTFVAEELEADPRTVLLAQLKRENCVNCNGMKQLYCGDCGGLRLGSSSSSCSAALLPARVELPFDILLLVHWHETLHKCTGVHAAVLTTVGTVEIKQWGKEEYEDGDEDEVVEEEKGMNVTPIKCDKTNNQDTHLESRSEAKFIYADNINSRSSSSSATHKIRKKLLVVDNHNTHSRLFTRTPVWADIALRLNECTDIILFPADNAVDAETFNWRETGPNISTSTGGSSCGHSIGECDNADAAFGVEVESKSKKWRLVVIEATWNHAVQVVKNINGYRKQNHMAPIPCIRLNNITGQYWRFQNKGHSAVSTIEAIAHTAKIALNSCRPSHTSTCPATANGIENTLISEQVAAIEALHSTLLTLFRVQKYRVLKSIQAGGKPPKAVLVTGSGLGSWAEVMSRLIDMHIK